MLSRLLAGAVPDLYMIKRMLLREVEYARPGSVEEAVRLLGAHDGARALAGGQTLVNVMKARAASPEVLVDLADLDELRTIGARADGSLELGAMVTYSELVRSPDVAAARPLLAEVAATIADRQVQNRGTVGGNVCVNDPTNHLPPLFSAIGATFTILGPDGERTVDVRRLLPRRLHDRRRRGRVAHARHDPAAGAGERRRHGGHHARQARHLHRERRGDRRAGRRARRARLRLRRAGARDRVEERLRAPS